MKLQSLNKNVLIVTIWDNKNHGNRLQNYALQEVIKTLGCTVRTATFDPHPYVRRLVGKKAKLKEFVKKILALLGSPKYRQYFINLKAAPVIWDQRERVGAAFSERYVPDTEYIGKFEDVTNIDLSGYDVVVAGSDQIWHLWNPGEEQEEMTYYSLSYIPEEKRVVYAGSFGFDMVPEERVDRYREILNGYRSISVRENTGAEIVKQLTGRDVPVVLDPTLMLNASQWEEIETRPANAPEKEYILVYALGRKSPDFEADILEYQKRWNCDVVDMLKRDKTGMEYPYGPSDFVYLIHHAEAVLTDSFHGTVFSIIFRKEVKVYQRINQFDMSDRIRTLAGFLGLEGHQSGRGRILSIDSLDNWDEIEKRLEAEKARSLTYLVDALRGSC